MLHIVKNQQALTDAVSFISANDVVLLVEEAIYIANPQHMSFPSLKGVPVYVLSADVKARGLVNRMSPSVTVIDYKGFVDLTAEQPNSTTWD